MLTLILLLILFSSGTEFLSTCSITSYPFTMALTLEDFVRISDKNRAEDLIKINDMIETGVRAEVERVVKPLQKQNEERFGKMESEISKLKDALKAPPPPPPPPPQPVQVYHYQGHAAPGLSQPPQGGSSVGARDIPDSDKVKEALKRARKIISLQPILKKDVARQYRMYEHVSTDDQAMKAAAIEYIECELKCKNIPNIVTVFPPANNPDYDRLYVEFEDEVAASHVSSYSRVIRKPDHQVSLYVPRNFQPRFRAYNEQARLLRTAPGLSPGDVKTKLKYGLNDFILLSKSRNGHWKPLYLNTENFPPLFPPPGPALTTDSPPPGRPRGSLSTPSPQSKRGTPPPYPPNNPNKRGASSPLESGAKVTRPSELLSPPQSEPCNESTPSLPPTTPLYTPSPPAEQDKPTSSCDQDSGQFAQTAVCSPLVNTNKDFTFDTRRLSLPAGVVRNKSLN